MEVLDGSEIKFTTTYCWVNSRSGSVPNNYISQSSFENMFFIQKYNKRYQLTVSWGEVQVIEWLRWHHLNANISEKVIYRAIGKET